MEDRPLLLDSITDASEEARDRIIVSGSHGGHYPAAIASQAGVRAVLFSDAGKGVERAGVAGVLALAEVGMAAAATDCHSCWIGSARDALARGRISVVNTIAHSLGVNIGSTVADAIARLGEAPAPFDQMTPPKEARSFATVRNSEIGVWLLDSASLVKPDDSGQILITGSHGGLVGGDRARALKAKARIAVFNDAGIGIESAGISRLPVLESQKIAAVAVDCMTARIGDALSALESGIISRANRTARSMGASDGQALENWLQNL